jgi:hypothetical protein
MARRTPGTSRTKVEIDTSGPLFEGRTGEIIKAWLDPIKKEIAGEGHFLIGMMNLDKSGRGTGHYQSELRVSTASFGNLLVTDPVIYGFWLETGHRRGEATRFKGYHMFRKARLKMNRSAKRLTAEKMPELVYKLNGPG